MAMLTRMYGDDEAHSGRRHAVLVEANHAPEENSKAGLKERFAAMRSLRRNDDELI